MRPCYTLHFGLPNLDEIILFLCSFILFYIFSFKSKRQYAIFNAQILTKKANVEKKHVRAKKIKFNAEWKKETEPFKKLCAAKRKNQCALNALSHGILYVIVNMVYRFWRGVHEQTLQKKFAKQNKMSGKQTSEWNDLQEPKIILYESLFGFLNKWMTKKRFVLTDFSLLENILKL